VCDFQVNDVAIFITGMCRNFGCNANVAAL
jgi:hypothetical protein